MAACLLAASPAGAQPARPAVVGPVAAGPDRTRLPFTPLLPIWTVELDAQPSARPATDAARLFVPWANGTITSYDLGTGVQAATRTVTTVKPLVVEGSTLLVTGDGLVEGLRTADLEPRWQTPLPAKAAFAPAARGGWAFVALEDGSLVALRADTGAIVWKTGPEPAPTLAPVVEGDRLYASAAGGVFVARTVADGREVWRTTLDGDVTAAAAVEGRVFAATAGRWLYALDARRGQVRWRYRIGASAIGMVVDDDRVVLVMLDQSIRAFKVGSGAQVWRQTLSFRPVAGPVVAGGSILVTGYAPVIRSVDRLTGKNQGTLTAWLSPGTSAATESLASGPVFQARATAFDDVVVMVTQRGWFGGARRLFEPPAAPLTVMPTAGLPAPSPPPGWVPPPAPPKTESAPESPAAAAPGATPAPAPAATPATTPAVPPPPAPKPPR